MRRYLFLLVFLLLGFFVSAPIHAQQGGGGGGANLTFINPLYPCDSFDCVAQKVINILFNISVPLAIILTLIGAFQMITAGGDPEKFSRGRKTILYTVVGFVIVLVSTGLVSIIESIFKK